MRIITTEAKPIKMWLDDIEEGALEQARHLANLPFTFKHVALMPDAHQGYGMPIGGVLAAKDVIIPNAVGVDIGCGMCAVKTSLTTIERNTLQKIITRIKQTIPLGFAHHKQAQQKSLMPKIQTKVPIVEREYTNARHQLGTLGGGNHFIEIQKGSDNNIWIMIHSGSRNIGKQVADHYNREAKRLNKKTLSPVPPAWQLSYLPLNTNIADTYINEMQYCIDFAFANRKYMMRHIMNIFIEALHGNINFAPMINIAHNYAHLEEHFNTKVMVHRKGATQAFKGQAGIIPGSQGSKSYLIKGKGNPESFMSCSHGAGRKMGRRNARKQLNLHDEIYTLEKQGIIHSLRSSKDLDEASSAYKDITKVMRDQDDLINIIVELSPLGVVKG